MISWESMVVERGLWEHERGAMGSMKGGLWGT